MIGFGSTVSLWLQTLSCHFCDSWYVWTVKLVLQAWRVLVGGSVLHYLNPDFSQFFLGVLCGSFWRHFSWNDHWLCLLQRLQPEATQRPSFLVVHRGICHLCAFCCALQHFPEPSLVRSCFYTTNFATILGTKQDFLLMAGTLIGWLFFIFSFI